MEGPIEAQSGFRRGVGKILPALALLTACLWPWMHHLVRQPSLLGDDTQRVEDLQLRPLSGLLLRPFNEHLSPLFETVSWVAWAGAGRRLVNAPAAFTIASYVPFALLLLALGSLARRLLGGWAASGVAVAVFALTPVHAEVVYWYSASSFAWALAATCVAMEASDRARESGRLRWSALAALMAFLAPCGSGVGLLAAPSAVAVAWPGRRGRRGLIPPMAVALGTAAYLVMGLMARQHAIVGQSVERTTRLGPSVPWMLRAPLYLLASGPLARRGVEHWPTAAGACALAVAAVALLIWATRQGPRRVIAASAGLMAGGYLLTYPFRVETFPGTEILIAGRYQLYPMAGLALILGAAAAPALDRLERARRGSAGALVLGLAVALMLANQPAIRARSLWHKFPEQSATLRGLDRLAEVCRDRGITRDQAIARLDPILARWNNPPFNTLRLLPRTVDQTRVADEQVLPTILADLNPDERRSVFGGTDVSARLVSGADWPGGVGEVRPGALVARLRVHEGAEGHYRHDGYPSYLEYDFAGPSPPVAIRIPRLSDAEEVQLWWADASGRWSAGRSVTLAPKVGRRALADVLLPMAAIPHIEPGEGGRVRLFFSRKGEVALAAPEAVRGRLR